MVPRYVRAQWRGAGQSPLKFAKHNHQTPAEADDASIWINTCTRTVKKHNLRSARIVAISRVLAYCETWNILLSGITFRYRTWSASPAKRIGPCSVSTRPTVTSKWRTSTSSCTFRYVINGSLSLVSLNIT